MGQSPQVNSEARLALKDTISNQVLQPATQLFFQVTTLALGVSQAQTIQLSLLSASPIFPPSCTSSIYRPAAGNAIQPNCSIYLCRLQTLSALYGSNWQSGQALFGHLHYHQPGKISPPNTGLLQTLCRAAIQAVLPLRLPLQISPPCKGIKLPSLCQQHCTFSS